MFETIKAALRHEIREAQEMIIHLSCYENRDEQIQALEHRIENLRYELDKLN